MGLEFHGVDFAPTAPLPNGVGSVLDWEVYFPLAGYAGPGFHNWPGSADVLVGEYETGDSHPKKIVRRDVRRRDRGQRPTASASVTSQSVSLWK